MIFIRYSIKELIISIGLGLILSIGVVASGASEPISWEIIFLLLASIGLGWLDKRFTCLAYTIAIVYLLDAVLVGLRLKMHYFTLPYEKLIILVGLLHIIEGILTYLYGEKDNRCVINYKRNQIAGGYQAYRKWSIPLFLFTIKGIYVPFLCILVYGDETYTMHPKLKAKYMGKYIMLYGALMVLMGGVIYFNKFPLALGMIATPIFHEMLFHINDLLEQRELLYVLPSKGVRVIEINHEQKQRNKIMRGDIILKINGKEVMDEEDYNTKVLEKRLVMVLEDLKGNKKILSFDQAEYQGLEVIVLPEE